MKNLRNFYRVITLVLVLVSLFTILAACKDELPDSDEKPDESLNDPNYGKNLEDYQKKITFKVVNGKWNDGTSADITVYITLEKDGVWDVQGSGVLETPLVGSMPDSGYDAGSWDTVPPATVSGTAEVTYTYTYASAPVSYKVEHYKAGTLVETEILTGNKGDKVTATAKTYSGYCLDTQDSITSATLKGDDVVIKLYYELDANGTNFPDKYEKKVIFKVVNGAWDGGSDSDIIAYAILVSSNRWDENGSALITFPVVGNSPYQGYKEGSWDTPVPTTVSGTEDVTYTYTYAPALVSYKVEHYKAGKLAKTETLSGNEGGSVTATPETFSGYCFNTQDSVTSATLNNGNVVIKLYYDIDANGDKVPDKYQKKVTFKVVNGRWNDGKTANVVIYVTLIKSGKWDKNGNGTVKIPAVGSIPDPCYKAGSWNTAIPTTASGTADVTYTYTYKFDATTITVGSTTINFGKPNTVLSGSSPHFPSIIELKHQPNAKDNGKLIAAISASGLPGTMGCILKSSDNGNNWEVIYYPKDTFNSRYWAGNMAHIYELPARVGNMPAGTLVYSSNTVNYEKYSHIGVWISTDCGKTWTEISVVASGGGLEWGVWEPVMFYDNGYLYCFYSDDTGDGIYTPDQKIVYQRSKDGINWEAPVDVCSFSDPMDRPGMPIITKMGNGEYFLVYEYCEGGGARIYYKTTKDITNWNPSAKGTPVRVKAGSKTYEPATAPSCVWTPAGGPNGTLIVTGRYQFGGLPQNSIFVSLDYGKTWKIAENPLSFTGYDDFKYTDMTGYRPIMVVGSDTSTIHYINATASYMMQYVTIKIGK